MAEPLRHRQTKEAATDMFSLQPTRHISTLHIASIRSAAEPWTLREQSGHRTKDDMTPVELLTVPSRAFSIQQTRARRRSRVSPHQSHPPPRPSPAPPPTPSTTH